MTSIRRHREEPKAATEFGRGFVQQLVYFSEHTFMMSGLMEDKKLKGALKMGIHAWACGAYDHLCEMEAPPGAPQRMRDKVTELQDLVLKMKNIGSTTCTRKNFTKAVNMGKDLSREADRMLGVDYDEGQWQ